MVTATKPRVRKSRSELLASIAADVGYLVERDRFSGLEMAFDTTGYTSNMSRSTSAELGAVLVAIAAAVPMQRLREVAGAVAFERVMMRPNDTDPEAIHRGWERRRAIDRRWHRANAAAQLACGGAA